MEKENQICANCGKTKEKFHSKKNLFCNDIDAKPLQKFIPKQEEIKNFELMKDKAELKALSKFSLENPLSEEQHKRIMELKERVLK